MSEQRRDGQFRRRPDPQKGSPAVIALPTVTDLLDASVVAGPIVIIGAAIRDDPRWSSSASGEVPSVPNEIGF